MIPNVRLFGVEWRLSGVSDRLQWVDFGHSELGDSDLADHDPRDRQNTKSRRGWGAPTVPSASAQPPTDGSPHDLHPGASHGVLIAPERHE